MGREIKRVPLDFDWPLNKVWPGFLPPDGISDDELDNWQRDNPPVGGGWQVWETVSEGSPISPVLATEDDCVAWLVGEGYSEAGAREFVHIGWAPSFVMFGGSLMSGIDGLGELKDDAS